MLFGAMNNPMVDVLEEIAMFADLGFDFIDLTLEPEETYPTKLNVRQVAKALNRTGLKAVGHTAWYLPIASPFREFRKLAIKELEMCLKVLHELGVDKMNVHPQTRIPLHDDEWIVAQNVDAIAELADRAAALDMKILVENMPHFSRVSSIKPILDAVPDALLLLDIGHANLDPPYNRSEELLANFGAKLGHVHVSDNRGGYTDEHLPLGVGNINWPRKVQLLKNISYDGTVTIEVFGDDDDYMLMSREKFRKLWDATEAQA